MPQLKRPVLRGRIHATRHSLDQRAYRRSKFPDRDPNHGCLRIITPVRGLAILAAIRKRQCRLCEADPFASLT